MDFPTGKTGAKNALFNRFRELFSASWAFHADVHWCESTCEVVSPALADPNRKPLIP